MIKSNSEILFLYDAQMCNPNGDMDNENKPRMDYDTSINLVSDVRLKRYIRDYLETIQKEEIFVTANVANAKEHTKQLTEAGRNHTELIDVRMFGVVTAEADRGGHLTGPIQFNWGYSLHPVELVDSSTITSSFSDGKGIGKDYRLHYSLIAFSGTINANSSKGTTLSDNDVQHFDQALLRSIPLARTRSKIGQYPRLYLRIELKDNSSFMKDLRPMLQVKSKDPVIQENLRLIRKPEDYYLDVSHLVEYLTANKEIISKIYYFKDAQLEIPGFDEIFVKEGIAQELFLLK